MVDGVVQCRVAQNVDHTQQRAAATYIAAVKIQSPLCDLMATYTDKINGADIDKNKPKQKKGCREKRIGKKADHS